MKPIGVGILTSCGFLAVYLMVHRSLFWDSRVLLPKSSRLIFFAIEHPVLFGFCVYSLVAICEVALCYFFIGLIAKRYSCIEASVSFGLGFGSAGAVLVGLAALFWSFEIRVVMASSRWLGTASEVGVDDLESRFSVYCHSAFNSALLLVLYIALSVLLWASATNRERWWLLPTAMIFRVACSFPILGLLAPGISQWWVTAVSAFTTILIAFYALRWFHRCQREEKQIMADKNPNSDDPLIELREIK